MNGEIENLFIWDKKLPLKQRAKEWFKKELSGFWEVDLRSGFIYATWVVIGLLYGSMMAINIANGEWKVVAVQVGMIMWFLLWCIEAYFHMKTRKILRKTFDSWSQTIASWGDTAKLVEKLERENNDLRKQI